jgi:ABC-type branched-subunit amino acid transport system permease subunit
LFVTNRILALGLLALSIGLVWGLGGMWVLGQGVFFGLAAYAYAILTVEHSVAPFASMAAALAITGGAAIALAALLLPRVRDASLALVTLALAYIAEQSAQTLEITGGFNGVLGVPPLSLTIGSFQIDTGDGRTMAIVAGSAALLVYAFLQVLARTGFGSIVAVIRDDDALGAHLGYRAARYRGAIFTLSAVLAGASGVLVASIDQAVFPQNIGIDLSLVAVVWLLVGGYLWIGGALIGVVVLRYSESSISGALADRWLLIQGILLILVAVLAPRGLAGAVEATAERVRRWRTRVTTAGAGAPRHRR